MAGKKAWKRERRPRQSENAKFCKTLQNTVILSYDTLTLIHLKDSFQTNTLAWDLWYFLERWRFIQGLITVDLISSYGQIPNIGHLIAPRACSSLILFEIICLCLFLEVLDTNMPKMIEWWLYICRQRFVNAVTIIVQMQIVSLCVSSLHCEYLDFVFFLISILQRWQHRPNQEISHSIQSGRISS